MTTQSDSSGSDIYMASDGAAYDANGDVVGTWSTDSSGAITVESDTSGDGVADTQMIDHDGDGYFETQAVDTDGDGVTDVAQSDTDMDGYFDTAASDNTGDGHADVVGYDTDGDGTYDSVQAVGSDGDSSLA